MVVPYPIILYTSTTSNFQHVIFRNIIDCQRRSLRVVECGLTGLLALMAMAPVGAVPWCPILMFRLSPLSPLLFYVHDVIFFWFCRQVCYFLQIQVYPRDPFCLATCTAVGPWCPILLFRLLALSPLLFYCCCQVCYFFGNADYLRLEILFSCDVHSRTDGRDGAYWCRDARFCCIDCRCRWCFIVVVKFFVTLAVRIDDSRDPFRLADSRPTVNQTNNPSAQCFVMWFLYSFSLGGLVLPGLAQLIHVLVSKMMQISHVNAKNCYSSRTLTPTTACMKCFHLQRYGCFRSTFSVTFFGAKRNNCHPSRHGHNWHFNFNTIFKSKFLARNELYTLRLLIGPYIRVTARPGLWMHVVHVRHLHLSAGERHLHSSAPIWRVRNDLYSGTKDT